MNHHDQSISNADLGRLRNLIYAKAGINLGPEKKTMLELRLRPRLRLHHLESYAEYFDFLFSEVGQQEELLHLLDAVTTNKTDFFREPGHFEYLVQTALPEIASRRTDGRPVTIWSAGCSTGEEPYTLAVVLEEYALTHPGFRFSLLATDLCTTVLAKARLAIYTSDMVTPVSPELRRKYFMRSRDRSSNLMRVVPELRRLVEFRRLNFMDAEYGLADKVDILFCRNVIIYFDRRTQEQILRKLVNQLHPGGYAFLGHSETLHGIDVPLIPTATALYRKTNASC
jgi:chemotaxis protein methyltransferase CheR